MKFPLALFLGMFCLAGPGCSPMWHTIRTSFIEPVEYSTYVDCAEECSRDHVLARKALNRYQADHPGVKYSRDFCCGFKKGYAEYLYAGGTGCPPPLPPRCYWNACYQTPEGHKAIEDWFAGFREGTEAAKVSGERELVTVPASTALAPSGSPPQPPQPPQPPAVPSPAKPEYSVPGLDEVLPPPRPAAVRPN